MERLLVNETNLFLDNQLNCHVLIDADPTYLIYSQFLSQLHLPTSKWQFERGGTGKLEEEEVNELVLLDALLLSSLEVSNSIQPLRLFTYFLLQNYLGKSNNFNGVGIIHDRKNHFHFLPTSFEVDAMSNAPFFVDEIGQYCLKNLKKNDLWQAIESFFVLINEKLEPKIQLALTQYVSETRNNLDKNKLMEKVIDFQRLERLRTFLIKTLNRS